MGTKITLIGVTFTIKLDGIIQKGVLDFRYTCLQITPRGTSRYDRSKGYEDRTLSLSLSPNYASEKLMEAMWCFNPSNILACLELA